MPQTVHSSEVRLDQQEIRILETHIDLQEHKVLKTEPKKENMLFIYCIQIIQDVGSIVSQVKQQRRFIGKMRIYKMKVLKANISNNKLSLAAP